jgi:hypothetical protein
MTAGASTPNSQMEGTAGTLGPSYRAVPAGAARGVREVNPPMGWAYTLQSGGVV